MFWIWGFFHSILLILVLCSKIAEVLSVEATTDIPIEEESTTEPDLSTVLPTTNDVEEISSVEEKSHNVLNDDDNKEKEGAESQSERRKRQAIDDERNDSQHLDKIPQELDSSQLPVEHRGLDDEEVNDTHQNENSSSTTFSPWFSITSTLFLFIGFTRFHLNHF